MDDLEKTITNIPVHVIRWNTFAIVAPPMFLTAGLTLLMSDMVDFGTLFWAGVSMMSTTAFVWWVWVIHAIFKLTQYMKATNKNINKAVNDILHIRKELTKEFIHGNGNQ